MERTRIQTEVVGPYTGMRISGASEDVVEARFTISYVFDDVTIVFENIPGRWDRGNDRELVSSKIALQVQVLVNEIRNAHPQTTNELPSHDVAQISGAASAHKAAGQLPIYVDASKLSSAA